MSKQWYEGILNLSTFEFSEESYPPDDLDICRYGDPLTFPTLINEDELIVQITVPREDTEPYLYIYYPREAE